MIKPHAVGDIVWRGYARKFDGEPGWWPEIRQGRITKIHDDGTLTVRLLGCIPGSEGKRNPGVWLAWYQPPERYRARSDYAMGDAERAVEDINENVEQSHAT